MTKDFAGAMCPFLTVPEKHKDLLFYFEIVKKKKCICEIISFIVLLHTLIAA